MYRYKYAQLIKFLCSFPLSAMETSFSPLIKKIKTKQKNGTFLQSFLLCNTQDLVETKFDTLFEFEKCSGFFFKHFQKRSEKGERP